MLQLNNKIKKIAKIYFTIIFFLITNLVSAQQIYSYNDLYQAVNFNNPEVLKLQQEYNRSLLDVKDAWANVMPTVDFQATATYMVNPPIDAVYLNIDEVINSISWPTGTKPAATGQYIKLYDGMENSLYNIQATITQPLVTWGKIPFSIKLYYKVADIKKLQLASQQKKGKIELDTRLATLHYLEKINKILEEEKSLAVKLVEHSQKAEESGMLLHQNVLEAKIKAKELEIAQQDLKEQLSKLLLELSRLTALELISVEQIDYSFNEEEIEKIMLWNREEVMQKAVSGEQESIAMLTLLQDVNDLSVKISKASVNWKPDFAFQMTLGYGGSRFPLLESNWLRKDEYSLNFSLGIKTTVFDGGKKLNDVARKLSDSQSAAINREDTRLTIKQTLSTNWNTADVCTMRMEYQDLKIETVESKISQQELVFQTGYGSETDLLTSKINLCNEEIEKEKQALSRAIACLTIRFLSE